MEFRKLHRFFHNISLTTKKAEMEQQINILQKERDGLIKELKAKNEELEKFTYTVSHDLKSPLVTIAGFANYLEKDMVAGDIDRTKRDTKHIREAVKKMKALLDDLLELSRIGRLVNPPEDVPLNELAQEAINIVSNQIEKNKVQVDILPDLPPVIYADRKRMLEVLQNLIVNAVKFMGNSKEPHIEIGARENDKEVICYVRDNGTGIEPDNHEKIFDLFQRLDHQINGTGIGLALVRRIIEVHGGKTWVESEGNDKGSTFYFTLPQKKQIPITTNNTL